MAIRSKITKIFPVSLLVIIGITLFVVALLTVVAITQSNFSHKVVSITFTTKSGPVSPEFQQTQILALKSGNCEYTVNKVSPPSTSSKPCTVTTENFNKIVSSFSSFDVADKMLSQESKSGQNVLGGQNRSISVQLQDGTVINSDVDQSFIESIQPFAEDVELYVPQMFEMDFKSQ